MISDSFSAPIWVALPNWTCLLIAGADRQAFIHNFCTNDVKRLTPGESCEAFFTNVKGRIVGHGLIASRGHELLFLGSPGQAPRLLEHLDRYIIREDVQLHDATSEYRLLVVAGEVDVPQLLPSESVPRPAVWKLIDREYVGLIAINPVQLSPLMDWLTNAGFTAASAVQFDAMRIEAGTPLFGIDFDAGNLPQEIGRDEQAISFHKGCYLGQETVARIDALGHVNQQLVGVRFLGEDAPRPSTDLTSDRGKAGCVTSSTFSRRLGAPIGLAMVRRDASAPGTRLKSAVGACEVVQLPLKMAN